MNSVFDLPPLEQIWMTSSHWIQQNVFAPDNLVQLLILAVMILIGWVAGKRLAVFIKVRFSRFTDGSPMTATLFGAFCRIIPVLNILILSAVAGLVVRQFMGEPHLLHLVDTLLLAWVIIIPASAVIPDPFWSKTLSVTAWSLAALEILGVLRPSLNYLSSFGFSIGSFQFTILSVIKMAVFLFLALRAGQWLGDYIEKNISKVSQLSPSTHVLLSKIIKICIYIVVFLIALSTVGIDLSALTVLSGALGVGIGFGLQKVVSNYISGIILLSDKSIKPGDVIQIGDVYGWISGLYGRYVSVVTRDGHEYLIPNEDLITQQVINWTYTDHTVRLHVPVGISYESDLHLARQLMIESAECVERVLKKPKPVCHVLAFGDNSVDLELRIWIGDPESGIRNVMSQVYLNVWDRFRENDIEIPYPQRDVHLSAENGMKVEIVNSKEKD